MENIGVITQKPSTTKSGKWNYLDIAYENSEEFNQATSKLMNVLYKTNADGKCIVSDEKGTKYILDLIHSTYDTTNNIIRIFPYACHQINVEQKQNKEKNFNNKK